MMKYYLICFFSFILLSCQEEITLDLPQGETKLVVEGSIEPGFPPYIILTKNQGYFESIDINTYNNLFVNDVEKVKVSYYSNGVEKFKLLEQLTAIDSLPPIYTDKDYLESLLSGNTNNYDFSKEGETYYLEITWNNQIITAETTIPISTPLDCLWVEKRETAEKDFKCDIRAVYSDPVDQQNNILIKSKRTQHYSRKDSLECKTRNNADLTLKLVDAGSDILINGASFETYFPRPKENGLPTAAYNSYHTRECENDSILEFLEDIVLVKFCQIDEASMKFWRGLVRQGSTNGNPFAEPKNLVSNINGGLGVWTGYSPVYYKVPIIKDTVIKAQYDSLKIIDIF